jgi:SAM-dependent methyltransferase
MASTLKRFIPAPILEFRSYLKRQVQARKSPQEIFSEVYRAKAWDLDSSSPNDFFSGFGSHVQPMIDGYVSALTPILAGKPSVVDLGCGDFNIGKHIRPLCGRYVACDVVPELIQRNKAKFADLDVDFRHVDIVADPLPAGDVALIRQVLQHLNNAQISKVVAKLPAYKIIIVTEHIPAGGFTPNLDKATGGGVRLHGRVPSGVVLSEPPFNLPHRKSAILADVADGNDIIRTTAYFV